MGQFERVPWLRELEPQALLINSIDAKARGISNGDNVKVFNERGLLPKDIQDFGRMNAVYGEYFTKNPPARSTLEVAALPIGAAVEIEAVAVIGQPHGD